MKLSSLAFSFGILLAASTCFGQKYTITDLGTLGGSYSTAYGINASGQVTGCSGGRAFLYSNGTMKGLGGQTSCGLSINASGQLAGYATVPTPDGEWTVHAFMFSEGSLPRDLGTLGGLSSLAYGINASGSVIGTADTIDPHVQHVLLVPRRTNDRHRPTR